MNFGQKSMSELERFLQYLKLDLNYSEQTIKSYQQDVQSFLTYLSKNGESIQTANPQIIRMFLSEEMKDGKTKVTCCRRIAGLRHFYTFLTKQGVVSSNPFLLISAPKKEIRYPEALYLEQDEL